METEIPCVIPTQFAGIDLEWTDEKREEYMKANQWRKETVLTRKMKEIIGNPANMAIVSEFPNTKLATCSTYLTAVIVMVREYLRAKYPYSHRTRNMILKLHWLSQLRERIPTEQWIEICQIAEEWYARVQRDRKARRQSPLLAVSQIRTFYHDKHKDRQRAAGAGTGAFDVDVQMIEHVETSLEEFGPMELEKEDAWWA